MTELYIFPTTTEDPKKELYADLEKQRQVSSEIKLQATSNLIGLSPIAEDRLYMAGTDRDKDW
uniref:hypothetical protein n=1 Tax=Candidatus Similichlamydia epinepheli TaxID=1903953 RepID=UPI001959D88E